MCTVLHDGGRVKCGVPRKWSVVEVNGEDLRCGWHAVDLDRGMCHRPRTANHRCETVNNFCSDLGPAMLLTACQWRSGHTFGVMPARAWLHGVALCRSMRKSVLRQGA